MTKKLITISVILGLAMTLGLVGVAKAVFDDVTFGADTAVDIYYVGTTNTAKADLQVNSGGKVATYATDTDSVTVTLESGSDITFQSASGKIMNVDCSAGATYTAGVPSTMRVVYNASCPTVVLTIGASALTEANIKATPLTAATLSDYTVTFRTANTLTAGQKIKLVFGTSFTITESALEAKVTTFTDDGSPVGTLDADGLVSTAATKTITIAVPTGATIAKSSVINIVLDDLVTNPANASLAHTNGAPTMSALGIDIYTTTSGDVTIDSLVDQTPFNRIIELKPGWNIFAPSQELEAAAYATVLTPISGSWSAIYTLARADAGVMTWQTPTTIDPLYGYAIYITGSSTVKLPLDFAKETPSNSKISRSLAYKGWYLIGYVGSDTDGYMNAQDYCLDGLMGTNAQNDEAFTAIYDETGTTAGQAPSNHKFGAATEEAALDGGGTSMRFYQDYGYSVLTITDNLVLSGLRDENH